MKDRYKDFLAEANENKNLSDLHDMYDWHPTATESMRLLVTDADNNSDQNIETFLAKVSGLYEDLSEMESLLNDIKLKHSKILIEPSIHKGLNEEIENEDRLTKLTNSSLRIKRNQFLALSKKFHALLLEFRDQQLKFKEKCKQQIKSFLTISDRQLSDEDIEKAIENGSLYDYTKRLILAEKDKKALYDEVKSRCDDIFKLESSARELYCLFSDVLILIGNQSEMLDHIETNVECAVGYANKALTNVQQTKKMQRNLRKTKVILFIIVVILLILLFVIGSAAFCFYLPFICRK